MVRMAPTLRSTLSGPTRQNIDSCRPAVFGWGGHGLYPHRVVPLQHVEVTKKGRVIEIGDDPLLSLDWFRSRCRRGTYDAPNINQSNRDTRLCIFYEPISIDPWTAEQMTSKQESDRAHTSRTPRSQLAKYPTSRKHHQAPREQMISPF